MKALLIDLYKHLIEDEVIDGWFKWVGWTMLTAALMFAMWNVKSYWLAPLVGISIYYIWISSVKGVTYTTASFLKKQNFSDNTNSIIIHVIGTFFTAFIMFMLMILFVGLLKSMS